ncbi:MAG: hypothetical protein ACJ8AT_24780 [Hyalangium sp.]|uniref:hypothetical protein n=1 Tax=Hyalangium sp. TaxID=2028555 RepID=UPI00389AD119
MHQCTECGTVASEPRLKYCEECGAKMPEYKPPPLPPEGGPGGAALADSRPAKPAYTGPKWLEYVPAHSPTALGIILHVLALWLSILPSLAGVGPFWSFVMITTGVLMIAREYRTADLPNPLVDWIPEKLLPTSLPFVYSALAVAIVLPMVEFSVQPLLWGAGTALVVWDQRSKASTGREGYGELFDPRSALRGQRVLAFAGIAVCLLALFFTWHVEGEVSNGSGYASVAQGQVRGIHVPQPNGDSLYGNVGAIRMSGFELPMGSTVEILLMGILFLIMLRPEVERPVWLRFVPTGIMVIALAWVLVNMRLKVGPIMFLAGLIPVGLFSAFHALGRDELPAEDYGHEPPADRDFSQEGDLPPEEDFQTENEPYASDEVEDPPPEDEEMQG